MQPEKELEQLIRAQRDNRAAVEIVGDFNRLIAAPVALQ